MTIDKNKNVTIPQWVLSGIVSIVTASFLVWGILSVVESKVDRNIEDIKILTEKKVDRNEFNIVIEELRKLEHKIDQLGDDK